jgi:putative membrane protein
MEWKNIYRGMLMGASDVIPGVSGGTIAVVLGIYDRLIEAINGFFSKEWKKQLGFLVPLGAGVITSILLLADLIEWLFEHHPGPTQFAFLGLIIGVLPYLFHKAEAKVAFKMKHVLLLFVGAAIVASMVFFQTGETEPMQHLTVGSYIFLFFSGCLASSAMILPGISGSFILLIIGVYSTIIHAVSELRLDIIAVVGLGIVVGIVVMSRIINFFMENYTTGTYAVVIGLVIGSVAVIFPGWPIEVSELVISTSTFAAGLLSAFLLGRIEYK